MSIDNKNNPTEALTFAAEALPESRGHAERLAEEWQLAENTFNNEKVKHTISIFGSARIPDPETLNNGECDAMASFYADARELSFRLGRYLEENNHTDTRLITGGGPGIMEAASRGAFDAGHASIGLNIAIPREQQLNPFIAAKHSVEFQYFALRKMHFLKRARALIVFPGGFGTLDELFETLTLIQTKKMPRIPIILYGSEFWNRLLDLNLLSESGLIDADNLELYHVVNTVEEAFNALQPVMKELQ